MSGTRLAVLVSTLTSVIHQSGVTRAERSDAGRAPARCVKGARRSWSAAVAVAAALVLLGVALCVPPPASAVDLPPGFSNELVAGGLTYPGSIAFFPDGRLAIGLKDGIVRIVKNGQLLPTPMVDISNHVNAYWDRGLLNIAVDPNFPTQPYLYLLYTYEHNAADPTGPKTGRLSRVTVVGDTADPATEVPILGSTVGSSCNNFPVNTDCIPSDAPSHSVGGMRFAPDGTLFATLGEGGDFNVPNTDSLRAQNLDSLGGKMVHITTTGQGISTNPYWTGNPDDIRSKVWAYGLRNAFRFGLRPGTNVPYVGDVGWATWEEIDVAARGANLGWPCYEGAFAQPGYVPYATCEALASPTAGGLKALGTAFARVPASLGLGGAVTVVANGDTPPVGSTDPSRQYDSWDGNNLAAADWVGYTFTSPHTFNRVVFQEGIQFWDGGWFTTLTVQVRQSGTWVNVTNLISAPAYPGANGVNYETFTLTFDPIQGDGIRIYGAPGGAAQFVSVAELDVFEVSGGGGGGTTEVQVQSQAQSIFAKVPASLGAGGAVALIANGDMPPVGSADMTRQYDSWDGANAATEDWVGYTFASTQTFTKVVFQEGIQFWDGGWFNTLTVQVRQGGTWVNVTNQVSTPAYPGANGVNYETFTLTFDQVQGDGIRIYGAPGGSGAFISVGELQVFALQSDGSPPPSSLVTPPMVQWAHSGGAAAVGGTFYTGTVYPAQYQGAFFFGDYVQSWIKTLRADANDVLVPNSVTDFAWNADGPVDIIMGPDGLLYYVAIFTGEVRRLQYTAGNTPPAAAASGTPTTGAGPTLTVQFSSAGSSDPDGDPITFEWDFGDGSPPDASPNPAHTYAANGTYQAKLTVRDDHQGVSFATVTITVGNTPPVATITAPSASLLFKVGDVITYSGSATDAQAVDPVTNPQGTLLPSALSWQIILHHCTGGSCHPHPWVSGTGAGGTFTVPNHGDELTFEIILTATDASGLTNTVSRTIQPLAVQLTLATNPTGLQVVYDGVGATAPATFTTVANSTHTISTTTPQGTNAFQSWSDAGTQTHSVTIGTANTTYTATFAPCPNGQFRAQYFNNRTLTGTPVLTRCETSVNYNWVNGGPGNGVPNDNFSVRWTGNFSFVAGSRTFTTVSDDGVRLYVDGVLLINRWTDHAATTDRATRTMTAGVHPIILEYYERTGQAVMQLSW